MNKTPSATAAWRLIKPYWFSEDRWKGRLLLYTIIGLTHSQVYIAVLTNRWNAAFYNALQDKNLPEFMRQIGVFCILAAISVTLAGYVQYFSQMLHIRWRTWMNAHYQNAWLSNHAYYRLQVIYKNTDNPDQRIADDIDDFSRITLSLGTGLLKAIVTLFTFITILWGLSGVLNITAGDYPVAIPGYMVWAALLYAFIGTWLAHKIGKPLGSLNYHQQRFEANYRFSLVRLRENAENIAFHKGEPVERRLLGERFSPILHNWWQIMKKQKQLTWFTAGYDKIAYIFPVLVAAPRYFSGAIQLGGLMQTASAFRRTQEALSWLIGVYPQFAEWRATTDRLVEFTAAIHTSNEEATHCRIVTRTEGTALKVTDMTLELPDGEPLMERFNVELRPGDRLLLTGAAGSGKTTLLRALAGLWPYGNGEITMPANAEVLFVPQKPYMPVLALREIICYPHHSGEYDNGDIENALADAGLEGLIPYLDTNDNWTQTLSLGEQQKLAFARILLHEPDILLLDEATSSLDEAAEKHLYEMLVFRLPRIILVSAGHRRTLKAWHTEERVLQSGVHAEYSKAQVA